MTQQTVDIILDPANETHRKAARRILDDANTISVAPYVTPDQVAELSAWLTEATEDDPEDGGFEPEEFHVAADHPFAIVVLKAQQHVETGEAQKSLLAARIKDVRAAQERVHAAEQAAKEAVKMSFKARRVENRTPPAPRTGPDLVLTMHDGTKLELHTPEGEWQLAQFLGEIPQLIQANAKLPRAGGDSTAKSWRHMLDWSLGVMRNCGALREESAA